MHDAAVLKWVCLGALVPATALAERPEPTVGPDAYCTFVEASAEAESSLMVAPELFGSVGVANPGDVLGEGMARTGGPRPRVTLGVSWELARWLRGVTLQRRASAECRRYRALAAIESALTLGRDLAEASALEARERVLSEALRASEPGLLELRRAVAEQNATREELQAYELRLDGIRQVLVQTQTDRLRIEALPSPPEVPLLQLVSELHEADDEVERLTAALRDGATWELGIRGGYDQIVGTDATPVFGLVTFSWNTGRLWQGAANARAREGRSGWVKADVQGAAQRAQRLLRELETVHAAAQRRLGEVKALEDDLGNQLDTVERLQTRAVRRYRDLLRFEHARLRAERAYLDRRVERLGQLLSTAR